ncbi:MAG: putative acetyl xylan esterase AxeA [Hymenobacter sp.]|jgi:hypothetical protein|nr:putative acetyl xylan esterase AxeA [Hymenobacter sp.]
MFHSPCLRLSVLALALLPVANLCAQPLRPRQRLVVNPPTQKEKFQLYLLIGQSNMAGRGPVEAQDTLPNPRVLRLNPAGRWEIAKDPVHFDKTVAAVGPGLTFGKELAALDASVTIGLIPCAVGGSAISYWQPGAYFPDTKTHPYDDALARARIALQTGTLAGIIWNQGESDSNPAASAAYAQNLTALITQLRQDLQTPNVPFVAGQLPEFQFSQAKPNEPTAARTINAAVAQLRGQVPHYDFITAEGTHDIGDHTHLDAASARLMGHRYAVAMRALQAAKPSKAKPHKRP